MSWGSNVRIKTQFSFVSRTTHLAEKRWLGIFSMNRGWEKVNNTGQGKLAMYLQGGLVMDLPVVNDLSLVIVGSGKEPQEWCLDCSRPTCIDHQYYLVSYWCSDYPFLISPYFTFQGLNWVNSLPFSDTISTVVSISLGALQTDTFWILRRNCPHKHLHINFL